MTKTIDIQDAQQHLADLVDQAAAGIEIILTDGEQPRARLVAIIPSTLQRIPGLHSGSITTEPDFDDQLPDDFWVS